MIHPLKHVSLPYMPYSLDFVQLNLETTEETMFIKILYYTATLTLGTCQPSGN